MIVAEQPNSVRDWREEIDRKIEDDRRVLERSRESREEHAAVSERAEKSFARLRASLRELGLWMDSPGHPPTPRRRSAH